MNYYAHNSAFYLQSIEDACRVLRPYLTKHIKAVIQAGSGFDFIKSLDLTHEISIPFTNLPHFPKPRVEGHAGTLHIFENKGNKVVVLEGRYHCYEGRDPWEVVFPIRVLGQYQPNLFLFTNAAGSINPDYKPGDLVAILNHINLLNANPLKGLEESIFGTRFVSMEGPYDTNVYKLFEAGIKEQGIKCRLHKGVYLSIPGPSFETATEINAFDQLKADMVGMSTVLEVITARSLGIRCAGLSLVTNYASGRSDVPINHQDVLSIAKEVKPGIIQLLNYVMDQL